LITPRAFARKYSDRAKAWLAATRADTNESVLNAFGQVHALSEAEPNITELCMPEISLNYECSVTAGLLTRVDELNRDEHAHRETPPPRVRNPIWNLTTPAFLPVPIHRCTKVLVD